MDINKILKSQTNVLSQHWGAAISVAIKSDRVELENIKANCWLYGPNRRDFFRLETKRSKSPLHHGVYRDTEGARTTQHPSNCRSFMYRLPSTTSQPEIYSIGLSPSHGQHLPVKISAELKATDSIQWTLYCTTADDKRPSSVLSIIIAA